MPELCRQARPDTTFWAETSSPLRRTSALFIVDVVLNREATKALVETPIEITLPPDYMMREINTPKELLSNEDNNFQDLSANVFIGCTYLKSRELMKA